MDFDAEKFLDDPNLDVFDKLKKSDFVLLAKHLKLKFKSSNKKHVIKSLIIDHLIQIEIIDEGALEYKKE